MVYLWVDGDDEKWLAKKNAELKKIGKELSVGDVGRHRFNDNDELLFSLRSVEKFAPWVNHIFIVTDNQIPKWLNTNNPKITVVDHTEIMPAEALPCFNPVIIEFFIPNIEKLSEHFIYANDDMLFTAKTNPNYFFTKKGLPIVRTSKTLLGKKLFNADKIEDFMKNHPYCIQGKNSRKLVYDIVGDYNYRFECAHNIDAYRKSDMLNLLNIPLVAERFGKAIKNRFRNESDLLRVFFHLYGVAKHEYKLVERDFWTQLFQFMTFRFRDQPLYTDNIRKWKSRNIFFRKLTCIQECSDFKHTKSNHDYLMKFLPKKSEYEK